MSKYEIILYWSEDDQSFIAEFPELSDVWQVGKRDVWRYKMLNKSLMNG